MHVYVYVCTCVYVTCMQRTCHRADLDNHANCDTMVSWTSTLGSLRPVVSDLAPRSRRAHLFLADRGGRVAAGVWRQVYGARNTFWRKDVEVYHQLASLGPGYEVSYEDKQHLEGQVAKGRETIGRFVATRHPELRNFASQLSKSEARAVVPT